MKIDRNLPISRIAAELPGATSVFETLGIDYACAGDRTLADAAHAEGVDPELLVAALRRVRDERHAESWSDRSLVDLVRYLETQHHRFVRDEIGTLAMRLADVCTSPTVVPSEMHSLRAAFTRFSEAILPHMHDEERNVFHVIEAMERRWHSPAEPLPSAGDIEAHVRQLTIEHGAISAQLRTMRELRMRLEDRNELPPHCSAVLAGIGTLEAHVHEYMFLENCVLFPRALALGAELAAYETV